MLKLLWPTTLRLVRNRNARDHEFRARAPARDAETDRARADVIRTAITEVLSAAEREQAGLSRRVEDFLARAAVTLGNGDDEYLERAPSDSLHQDLFDREIKSGERRLKELDISIAHYKFLEEAVLSRFPARSEP